MGIGSKHVHITANGTTTLRPANRHAWLRRVVVGKPGTAGTVTIEDASGTDVAIIELVAGAHRAYEFNLDMGMAGLQVVAASFAGSPSVTVIYD